MGCNIQWGPLKDVLCLQNQLINSSERNLQDSYNIPSCLDSTYVNKDLWLPKSTVWLTSCSLTPSQSKPGHLVLEHTQERAIRQHPSTTATEIQLLSSFIWMGFQQATVLFTQISISLFLLSLSPPVLFINHSPCLGKITRAPPGQWLSQALSGRAAKAPRNGAMLRVTWPVWDSGL